MRGSVLNTNGPSSTIGAVRRGVRRAGDEVGAVVVRCRCCRRPGGRSTCVLLGAGAVVAAFAAVGRCRSRRSPSTCGSAIGQLPTSPSKLSTSATLPLVPLMLIWPMMFAGGSARADGAARRERDQVVLAGRRSSRRAAACRRSAGARRRRVLQRPAGESTGVGGRVEQLDVVVLIRRAGVAAAAVELADDDVVRRAPAGEDVDVDRLIDRRIDVVGERGGERGRAVEAGFRATV